jgi:hypothetical protein
MSMLPNFPIRLAASITTRLLPDTPPIDTRHPALRAFSVCNRNCAFAPFVMYREGMTIIVFSAMLPFSFLTTNHHYSICFCAKLPFRIPVRISSASKMASGKWL